MNRYQFGTTTSADRAAATTTRRALIWRCAHCNKLRGFFVVDRSHISSIDDVLTHGYWDLAPVERKCECPDRPEPSASASRAALASGYAEKAGAVIGPRPKRPGRRRFTPPERFEAYERELKDFEAEKSRYLAEPGTFPSLLSSHLDEEGMPALAQIRA